MRVTMPAKQVTTRENVFDHGEVTFLDVADAVKYSITLDGAIVAEATVSRDEVVKGMKVLQSQAKQAKKH